MRAGLAAAAVALSIVGFGPEPSAVEQDTPRGNPTSGKQRLAFAGKKGGAWRIYTMDASGGPPRQLTSGAFDRFPVWSPDGTRIAFGSQVGNRWALHIMSADGSNPVRVTEDVVGKGSRSWS